MLRLALQEAGPARLSRPFRSVPGTPLNGLPSRNLSPARPLSRSGELHWPLTGSGTFFEAVAEEEGSGRGGPGKVFDWQRVGVYSPSDFPSLGMFVLGGLGTERDGGRRNA